MVPESDAASDELHLGDPQGQRELYERYRDRVYSIALYFLKGDETAAQDATQDVFVKVFRSGSTFRQGSKVSSWLYRIVANTCFDELRRRRRLVLYGDMPDALHPAVAAAPRAGGDEEVMAAIRGLSPKLRMAVLLRYFDDLSYDDIGRALGCSTGTVASRLNRAHAILAGELSHRRQEVVR